IRPGATLINSGRITIEGNPDHETEYGIWNNGGTVINSEPAGNLSNSGVIDIVGLDVLDIGIENVGTFTNDGTILLDGHNSRGVIITEQGEFINNGLINIIGGGIGLRTADSANFTNRGILNIDRAINTGLSIAGLKFTNDIHSEININQRFRQTTVLGIGVFVGIFENMGGTIRIGNIERIGSNDIARAIQVSNNSSFMNSQGGLIYIYPFNNANEAIAVFGNNSFLNDRCSGIINLSDRSFRYTNANPTFANNGWIISYSNANNRITDNQIGTIINFGSGAFDILNDPDIPANNDPMINQDAFCFGTESIEFSSYEGTPNLDFCFDLVFKRLDNGETNTTGIFNDLQPGQSYDFEISYGGEAVDTFTYDIDSAVDDTPPTLDCTSESFIFDLEDDLSPTLTLDDLTTSDPTDADCIVATFEIQGYGTSRTFGCEDAGLNTLTVVAIDQAGNTNTCMVDVEITNVYPELSQANDLDIYLDEMGVATLSNDDLEFGVNLETPCFTQSEAEANYSVPTAFQNLDCNDIGTSTFLLDSADPNFLPTNQTITVIDTIPVRASVADVTVMLDASGVGTLDESDLVFTVSDNCFSDAEIEAGYSIPNEFRTLDCTQIGILFITLDKSNPEFPEVVLQVTVESTDLSFDPVSTDFCANFGFDLTSLEDQITTASGAFSYNKTLERLYIPREMNNTVSVIDLVTNTIIDTIAVGTSPMGVGVRPDGKKVYVTNRTSNDVSVIDVETNTVDATIDVGNYPIGTAFNADGSLLYVTNFFSNSISVINTATNIVVNTINTGVNPWGIALSPDDSNIYVANQGDNNVSVINASTGVTTITIVVQTGPYDVAISADGTKVYVSNLRGTNLAAQGAISIIDIGSTSVEETLFTQSGYINAYDFAVQPTGDFYTSYIGSQGGVITRVEPNNGNALTYYDIEPSVSNEIQGISLNEDGSTLYLVDPEQAQVVFFNTTTNTEEMSIALSNIGQCVGEFYVKTTLDIVNPTSYVPFEGEVINVAFDGGAECESTTTITFTTGDDCKLFVNADAALGGDGTTWATAFKYLQDALAVASIDNTFSEIWVAQGVYYPDEDEAGNVVDNDESESFQLYDDLSIFGGFNGTETESNQRDTESNVTILSGDIQQDDSNTDGNYIAEQTSDIQGDNSDHVLLGSGTDATAILDGFTITAGQADGEGSSDTGTGAGMLNISSDPTLQNLKFVGNEANVIGGGIYNNTFSSPTLTNVSFIGNTSNGNGGGLANRQQSNPILTNVVFSRNTAANNGGGMHNVVGTNTTLINGSFSQNTATGNGGAIYITGSDMTVSNSIFYGNTAGGSGNSIDRFLGSSPRVSYSYFDDASLPT
ncbi:MAG: YncE family protein, partial [Bacteroidota bacterium]